MTDFHFGESFSESPGNIVVAMCYGCDKETVMMDDPQEWKRYDVVQTTTHRCVECKYAGFLCERNGVTTLIAPWEFF